VAQCYPKRNADSLRNDNKNKNSASEEKAVRAIPLGKLL
jgi:hypothetical protein